MKYVICFFLLLVMASHTPALAQIGDTTFFDADWKKTERKNARFFRIIVDTTKGVYKVRDYYARSGKIQMTGSYLDAECKKRTGDFAYYNKKGIMTREAHFQYLFLHGVQKTYFEDGRIHEKEDYYLGSREGKYILYDSATGKVVRERDYHRDKLEGCAKGFFAGTDLLSWEEHFKNDREEGPSVFYDSFPHIKREEGNCINGFREGQWRYHPSKSNTMRNVEPDLEVTVTYESDKLNGPTTYYTPGGKKVAEGDFKNDKKTGKWKYVRYPGGPWRSAEGEYIDGYKHGRWIQYFDYTRDTESVTTYKHGKRDGRFTQYFTGGEKEEEGNYCMGSKCGRWIYYRQFTGYINNLIDYDESGHSGYSELYDENNGKLQATGRIKNDKSDGRWIVYYSGTKDTQMIKYMRDGKQEGYVCYFDQKTQKKIIEGELEDGERKGTWYNWKNKPGDTLQVAIYTTPERYVVKKYDSFTYQLHLVYHVNNGAVNGAHTTYFKNNNFVESKSMYINGKQNGAYYYYDSTSGDLKMKGYYLDDKAVGEWVEYFPDGRTKSITNYFDGQLHGYTCVYYKPGILNYSGRYKDGRRDGTWQFFEDSTGDLIEKVSYKNGLKDGKDIFYYNGRKHHTVHYDNGRKTD